MRRTLAPALVLVALAACTGGATPKASSPKATSSASTVPSTAPSPTPSSSASPKSVRFVVRDSSWISARSGWALGGGSCGTRSCVAVKATHDGGRTWRPVAAPDAGSTSAEPDRLCSASPKRCVQSIRFANRTVGYAFETGFYVTRDGARTWTHETAPMVLNLEISRGRAYRVVAMSDGCPGPCDVRLEVSDIGSRTWRELATPHLDAVATELIVHGPRVYFAAHANTAGGADGAHTRYLRSLDAGRTWSEFDDPCGEDANGENDGKAMAAAPEGVLSILCTSRMHPTQHNFVVTSTNDARTFGRGRELPNAGMVGISVGSASTIAVSAFRGHGPRVFVSHDGGRTWKVTLEGPVPDPEGSRYFLGFQDSRTARAAFSGRSIWTTRDAARTWTRSNPF